MTSNVLVPLLFVQVVEAKDLEAKDMGGTSDPFATIILKNQKYETNFIEKQLNPVWNEFFVLTVEKYENDTIEISIWDKNKYSKSEFMGEIKVKLSTLSDSTIVDEWYKLKSREKQDKETNLGTVHIKFHYRMKGATWYSPAAVSKQPLPPIVCPSHCFLPIEKIDGTAGHLTSFAIQAKDYWDQNITTGGAIFYVEFTICNKPGEAIKNQQIKGGIFVKTPSVSDDKNGKYFVQYEPQRSSHYNVAVTCFGEHIKKSPFTEVYISPGIIDAAHTIIDDTRSIVGSLVHANEEQQFTIIACDKYGNNINKGGDIFEIAITGPRTLHGNVFDRHTGSYDASFTLPVTGHFTINVKVNNENISKSPFNVESVSKKTTVNERSSLLEKPEEKKIMLHYFIKLLNCTSLINI